MELRKGPEDDLVVGVPSESPGVFLAGLAHVIYGDSSSAVTSSGSQLWTQDSEGVPDFMVDKDTFAFTFAGD